MIGRIFLHGASLERIAILERENCLVLGPVILVHAMDIVPERNAPDKQQEQRNADQAVDQVENDLLAEQRIHLLQFRRRQQRNELVHENEETNRKNDIHCGQPAADFQFLSLFVGLDLIQSHIG